MFVTLTHLPEKMHSTATADPESIRSENKLHSQARTYLALKEYYEPALRVWEILSFNC
jgi:hypothetical protein